MQRDGFNHGDNNSRQGRSRSPYRGTAVDVPSMQWLFVSSDGTTEVVDNLHQRFEFVRVDDDAGGKNAPRP